MGIMRAQPGRSAETGWLVFALAGSLLLSRLRHRNRVQQGERVALEGTLRYLRHRNEWSS